MNACDGWKVVNYHQRVGESCMASVMVMKEFCIAGAIEGPTLHTPVEMWPTISAGLLYLGSANSLLRRSHSCRTVSSI